MAKVKYRIREFKPTANCYFVKNGKIEDVEPAGWWY